MNLVIVESPAKAKTINAYLGEDYKVVASFGHVRDLLNKSGSVDPDKDFAMHYEISEKAIKYVNDIVKLAKTAKKVILATDPDREGEAIAWHIMEVLKEKKVVKDINLFQRVAFNEITKKAVSEAIANPRQVDVNLVNAQQARRALDYLVGFTLSPLLWKKLPGSRSAGRVQSVALRLICEREDEIERFISQEYWDIAIDFKGKSNENFTAKLTHVDGQKLEKFSLPHQEATENIVSGLKSAAFNVDKIEKKQQKRNPAAPFITSSLQQEASRKLGFGAKKTMQIAQKLYEGINIDGQTIGLITYMRTDGVNLSTDAVSTIRNMITASYGDKYLPKEARIYKSKAKNAQEAHEAIRPTDINLTPEKVTKALDKDQLKLYELIWKRTVACQMESVVIDMVAADIKSQDGRYVARATGSTIAFDGFYKVYQEGKDDSDEDKSSLLPILEENESLITQKIKPEQHFTEPPPRYSEASLVKKLEDLGIGRPSTYASIISVLQERNYATINKKRFYPSELGRLVTVFLTKYFSRYVEYDFTANLETDLDKIAEGNTPWKKILSVFWQGFNANISEVNDYKITDIIEYVQESLDFHLFGDKNSDKYQDNKKCHSCSNGTLSLKLGKYGAFLACSNYPECTYKKQISKNDIEETESENQNAETANDNNKLLGQDKLGNNVYFRKGPYGNYVQLGEDKQPDGKPKRTSLPANYNINNVNLEIALKFLSLPILLGNHSSSGEEISMGIGKFGPYIKYQGKFTSIPRKIDPFSIDISSAEALIASKQDKKRSDE